jgi:hypothetical protein
VRSIDQAGYRRTTPSSLAVSVTAGQTATARNFGHTPRLLVSGNVFNDLNKNTFRDTNEAGAGGWTVYLDKNANGFLDAGELSTVTDSLGNWSIKEALAGSYVVKLVAKAGMTSTPASGYSLSLAAGQSSLGKTFGVRKL